MSKGFAQFFEARKRDSGETFYTLRDNRPQWLYDAVHAAHVSDAPNDWIWEECYRAVQAIDEGTIADEDDLHEYADGRVDIYTRDLFQWVADMCLSDTFANAESNLDDMGERPSDMVKQISILQYCAIENIARTMLDAIRENEDEGDEDQESVEDDYAASLASEDPRVNETHDTAVCPCDACHEQRS